MFGVFTFLIFQKISQTIDNFKNPCYYLTSCRGFLRQYLHFADFLSITYRSVSLSFSPLWGDVIDDCSLPLLLSVCLSFHLSAPPSFSLFIFVSLLHWDSLWLWFLLFYSLLLLISFPLPFSLTNSLTSFTQSLCYSACLHLVFFMLLSASLRHSLCLSVWLSPTPLYSPGHRFLLPFPYFRLLYFRSSSSLSSFSLSRYVTLFIVVFSFLCCSLFLLFSSLLFSPLSHASLITNVLFLSFSTVLSPLSLSLYSHREYLSLLSL